MWGSSDPTRWEADHTGSLVSLGGKVLTRGVVRNLDKTAYFLLGSVKRPPQRISCFPGSQRMGNLRCFSGGSYIVKAKPPNAILGI